MGCSSWNAQPFLDKDFAMTHINSKDNLQDNQAHLEPNLNIAQHFLTILGQCKENDRFTFQVIPEGVNATKLNQPQILHGTFHELKEALIAANQRGCGIFVTINQTDGKGRKKENITGVRAVFVDLDGAPLQSIWDAPLSPHLIIESSPKRYHAYWIVEGISCEEFTAIQKGLAQRFGGDPQVSDCGRVMRLPGFYHLKREPYQSTILHESGQQPFSQVQILESFEINKEDEPTIKSQNINHNSILLALQRQGLIIKPQSSPKSCWIIHCPWKHLHSKQDLGTKYFEPNEDEYPFGGFKCFHAHCVNRTLKDLIDYLGIRPLGSSEPMPLHRPLDKAQPFPFEALGEILMPAALALKNIIQAPDAICAQSVLGATSLSCQPFANIFIDGREIPLSLFLLTVAESGDRKSATDSAALRPIYLWQKMLDDQFREEIKGYKQSKELWDSKKKDWLKDSSKGRFLENPLDEPLHPLILVEEPTYEGIVKYLAIGQPSVGLFSDEGGRFFGGHAMSDDQQLKTISGLSSLWDGKVISRLRSGDGNMLLYGRRVSLHLMIQEIILEKLMSNRMVEYQGFLPRCLIAFPSSTAGKRPYVEKDITQDPAMRHYYDRLNNLLDRKFPVDPHPAPQNALKPPNLFLTDAAKREWICYHDGIDQDLAPGKPLEQVKRLASKAAEHVLRLAGNLAMIEQVEGNQIKVEDIQIRAEDIQRGILLMEYYLNEYRRIQGCLSIHPDIVLAQKLLNWCWNKGKEIVTLKEVYQYGPIQFRDAKTAKLAINILEGHGWAIPTKDKSWIIRQPI